MVRYRYECSCGHGEGNFPTRAYAESALARHAFLDGCMRSPRWDWRIVKYTPDVPQIEDDDDCPF